VFLIRRAARLAEEVRDTNPVLPAAVARDHHGVEVPVVPEARRSGYLKVRDRESFEFALASAAVALDITAGSVRGARVAVGGVGTVPWRLQAVERAIIGRTVSPDLWRDAALHAADGAKPLSENAFKVELVKRTVERQLATVAGLP
jgi:xanthine dehydrogenase YagS FAD-binding subunit